MPNVNVHKIYGHLKNFSFAQDGIPRTAGTVEEAYTATFVVRWDNGYSNEYYVYNDYSDIQLAGTV